MKKILLKLALLGATLFAYNAANAQTVAVTGDLKTMFNSAAATKTQVCFSLTDGNGNQLSNPRTSSGVIVPTATQCVLPDGSGHISTTVIANDQITPANSIYSVTYLFNSRVVHGDIFQFALADGTENLNTKISLSVIPIIPSPTGDTTYARLDGVNQPFTGTISAPIFNSTTGFRIANIAAANTFLKGNGTNFVAGSPILASADFANQGTATTVLHGNAAGNPSFAAISLTTDVTGILPLGNLGAPTGTGFAHLTSGAWDAVAKLISLTSATDIATNQGTATTLLHGNAAGQASFGSVVSADLNITATTCTNQFLTAISATGVGTCTTDLLASAQHANQGTVTTVLHGNGAGNPSFAVVTPSDASGNTTGSGNFALASSPTILTPIIDTIIGPSGLPVHIHPGSGASQALLVDSAAGAGTNVLLVSNTGNVSLSQPGTFLILSGATSGQINLGAAATASGTITVPAGNDTLVALALTQTLTNKRVSPRVVTVSNSTTLTPDGDNSDVSFQNNTQVAGTLTIAAPSGTPTDGQKLIIRVKSTNAQTYSFNATYRFSTTTTVPTTLAAGKTDYLGAMWNATDSKWDVVAVDQGH